MWKSPDETFQGGIAEGVMVCSQWRRRGGECGQSAWKGSQLVVIVMPVRLVKKTVEEREERLQTDKTE